VGVLAWVLAHEVKGALKVVQGLLKFVELHESEADVDKNGVDMIAVLGALLDLGEFLLEDVERVLILAGVVKFYGLLESGIFGFVRID